MADGNDMEQQLVAALKSVRAPSGKDLVEAALIAGVTGAGDSLTIQCRDSGFPDPIKQRLEREISAAIKTKLPTIQKVSVTWSTTGEAAPPSLPIRHVVAVGSGKGGVGKSTIAAALAYGLMHRGNRVGILDADIYGPSIPHLLGLREKPAVVEQKLVPLEVDGIKVISMGLIVPVDQAVVWRGPMLDKQLTIFLHACDWGELDYLIVDLPPGTGDVVLSLSQKIPLSGGVIVCTPQDVALLDARKAVSMFQTVKVPCRGLVENMSFFLCPDCGSRTEIFGHGGAQRWAAEREIPFLGAVPINLGIRVSGDEGRLRDIFAADCPLRPVLLELTDRLVASLEAKPAPAAPTLEIV